MNKGSTKVLIAAGILVGAILILAPLNRARAQGAPVVSGASSACTPGSWVNKAVYPLSVYGAANATDGTFAYVFGGNTIGGSQHSEANRYDPVSNTWSPLASMTAGAPDYLFHGEYGGNGKIYVIGGLTNGTTNRIYDIAGNSWSTGAAAPVAVYDYAHAFSGGKFYLIGGIVGGVASSGVYAYDVASNTWSPLASLPQAEFNMASGVIGGKIYVAGGSTGSNFITNLYIYDIAGNSWSAGPPKTIGTNFSAGTVVGGQLWVIGGGNPFAPDSFANTEIFDPGTNSWSAGPSLILARSFADAVTLSVAGGQMALIVGGFNSGTGSSINSVEGNTSACGTSLSALSPAKVWVGLANSDDVGIKFDLQAVVSVNGSPVGSGHLDSVAGGSSGFNNAKLDEIPLTLPAPVTVSTGDSFSIEVFARNACSGSGHNSGRARLWYNGQPTDTGATRDAGSRFDATIGGSNSDYFLRTGGALSTTAGAARTSVDVQAGAKCGPFVSFGTWTTTLP